MHEFSSLETMPIRHMREGFGTSVASGRRIVVCRRSNPLGVLLPKEADTELVELDQEIAAVLRGRVGLAEAWNFTNLIEALAKVAERR